MDRQQSSHGKAIKGGKNTGKRIYLDKQVRTKQVESLEKAYFLVLSVIHAVNDAFNLDGVNEISAEEVEILEDVCGKLHSVQWKLITNEADTNGGLITLGQILKGPINAPVAAQKETRPIPASRPIPAYSELLEGD